MIPEISFEIDRSETRKDQRLVLERNASIYRVMSGILADQAPTIPLDMLPLHSAISSDATVDELELFVDLDPGSAKKRDSHGNLPLHRALKEGCEDDVVLFLLEAYPGGTRVKENEGNLPVHLALSSKRSPSLIESILEAYPRAAEVEGPDGLPLNLALKGSFDLPTIEQIVWVFHPLISCVWAAFLPNVARFPTLGQNANAA